ncbi:cadmium resistance protein CadD (predicted permease) [Streptosporangium becharense]|uniref:Cadmium resistance protein CadD (Predicted permease) n=1 Tax=Streptosporangium becharense TaxID=1816182 RepID=A0A7W9IH89_9ACTN|nr:cadmium resistance transporter [Streptosporangium becharense]MBB2914938.1 cadmium resistance protein CadD (predicted permease) [Streptosporangium becharense]MBB5820251.1 cadmium resistance protein CadD (predicted permease) [Streptosporangium becharense]
MGRTIATAAAVFAGTNIDDILILTVLFLTSRARGLPRPRQIVAGQYAGIAALVAVSAVAALGLAVVPDRWVGLLGLVPFGMGLRGLVRAGRSGGDEPEPVASGVFSVAGVTVANGADNISVYTPMFRTIGPAPSLVTVTVFAVLVAVWCAAASWLGSHGKVVALVERTGRWLVPLVFMVIGGAIVAESVF